MKIEKLILEYDELNELLHNLYPVKERKEDGTD